MTDFKQDARRIQQLIGAAKNSADALSLLAENYAAEPSKASDSAGEYADPI
jgi:hypothetical protein